MLVISKGEPVRALDSTTPRSGVINNALHAAMNYIRNKNQNDVLYIQ